MFVPLGIKPAKKASAKKASAKPMEDPRTLIYQGLVLIGPSAKPMEDPMTLPYGTQVGDWYVESSAQTNWERYDPMFFYWNLMPDPLEKALKKALKKASAKRSK